MDSQGNSMQLQLIDEQVGAGHSFICHLAAFLHPVLTFLFFKTFVVSLQDAYIQSRADTMQNIESTIVELGSIFQQLAHMVKEQEETIQR